YTEAVVTQLGSADATPPTRTAHCCWYGVEPPRNPVFRSCDAVPPFDEAMQTTAAIVRAVSMASGPVRPRIRKIKQTSRRVAIVMPEMGLDDDPTSPVSRLETVTNRKPKSRIMTAPSSP